MISGAPRERCGDDAKRGGMVVLHVCPEPAGGLLGAGLVDELFLTIAPRIDGRSPAMPRLALVEGFGYEIGAAPWAELGSVMRSWSHLFLRYRVAASARPT